ncbi:MAG: hypothetical protein JNJ99_16515 [Crocinitomicaceae bacterium]|nr:hypothetical protein [Crocinitomicaceae bacterium]
MSKQIHIPINKFRLKLTGLVYAIIALAVFLGFFLMAEKSSETISLVLKITGGVIAVVLLFTGASALKLLNDKSAGIWIDANGITDKSSSISVGLINWKIISSLESNKKEKMMLIHVKKNDDILKSASNKAIRQLLERNIAIYKTPVILEIKYLKCSFEDLENALNQFYKG